MAGNVNVCRPIANLLCNLLCSRSRVLLLLKLRDDTEGTLSIAKLRGT